MILFAIRQDMCDRKDRGDIWETSGRLFDWDDIKLCHWVPKGSIFLKIDQNQLSFLFGFYLKIRERKKLERKKVRARPLYHPRQPTHEQVALTGNQHCIEVRWSL